jgi:cell division protein FtsQ
MEGTPKRRTVRKRKKNPLVVFWQILCWMTSSFLKAACLLVCLMMISVFFLTGYRYLLHSPHIRLEKVVIRGVEDGLKRELLDMSGLHADMSLLSINTRDLKEKLEKHPWIQSVQVNKRYPHALEIQAVREEPWAVVSMGELFYMNRQGKIFKRVGTSEDLDYPVITGSFDEGEKGVERLEAAAKVLSVLEDGGEAWMREELAEIHLDGPGSVSLYFQSFPAVVRVRVDELGRKIHELSRIVDHLRETNQVHKVTGINLHYRDGAVVSFRRG